MKTLHYTFCLFVLVLHVVFTNAATYTWSAQVAGSLTYTTGNMSAVITNTNFNTTGPQDPNGGANNGYKSPKYVSTATINTYQGGFTNDYGMPGLVLGVDWSNLNSSTTLTITFANPVAGPVSFNIYDINTGSWSGYDPVWSDRVNISGTDCAGNFIAPAITGCAPTLPNGTNIVTGTQSCTNQTNTITFNSTGVKSITIVYSSNSPLASGYGNDPDPQYIIISDITYNNFTPLTVLNQPWQSLSCTHQSVTLMPSPLINGTHYDWSNGGSGVGSITVQVPGTYTVTATHVASGCTATAMGYVGIDTTKPTVTVNPSTATITCASGGSALTAQSPNANLNYLWNDGDTIQVNVGNAPGTYTVTVTDKANGCTASASATVSIDTVKPTVQILPPDTLSCANPTVTLTATSPNSGLVYIWPGGLGSGPVKTVSAPGMYYVLVSFVNNGCSAADTVYVQQTSSAVNAGIAPPGTLTCTNTSVTLSAVNTTQTATYTWNTGATGPTLTVTQPGTYTLIVSSGGNCADTASVTVTQNNTPPTVQVNPTSAALDCSTTTATFTASTNATNATYNWSNTQTTSNITVSTAGTYAVTVTDAANGCTATASATVTQTATPPTVTIQSSGGIDCANAQVTLTANTSTAGATYSWSNSSTAAATTVTTAGTYSVTVTDPNGCTASATTTVTSSASSIIVNINTPAELTCADTSVALTATSNATNYVWSTGETTSGISVTQPGTYTVTAASGVNCSGTATVTVTQNTQTPLVSIGPPQVITCFNPSVALVTSPTSPDYIYVWNTGEQTANITVTTANNYVVTVTDNTNGCSATSAMPVAENTTPPVVTVNNGELNCRVSVDTLFATAAGNNGFMWNTGSGNDFIYVTTEGTYTVTVTDTGNGCTATAQGTVVSINSVLSLNAYASGTLTEETTEVDITASSNAALPAFSWSNGDSTAITTVTQPGDYSVTVTDNSTGCTAAVTVNVLQNLSNNIFVPNAFTPNGDGNNDVFSIYGSIKNIGFLQVQVFNRWGEKVFESNDHHFAWDGTYKGKLQNPGVYIWQLKLAFTNGQVDELRKGSVTILK